MPAYNAEKYIAEAIKSAFEQTYSNWELIIIDDGSKDNTRTIAQDFHDPRITLVHQSNSGEATARNHALSLSKGEYVAFLDSDDCYLPNHLEETVGYLRVHPNYSGVYSDGFYCNQVNSRLEKLSSHRIAPVEGRIYHHVVHTSSVFGPPLCVVLKREVITRNNLTFDPEITIGPDWDFFIRYSDHSEFGSLNVTTCLYRVHGNNISIHVNSVRRLRDLARCRTKAIHMPSFQSCPVKTREFVFYDLLMNLFSGLPAQQAEVTQWPQFHDLPAQNQARLLRLAAADELLHGNNTQQTTEWLRRSRAINPSDVKGALLFAAHRLSPGAVSVLLRAKRALLHNKWDDFVIQNAGAGNREN